MSLTYADSVEMVSDKRCASAGHVESDGHAESLTYCDSFEVVSLIFPTRLRRRRSPAIIGSRNVSAPKELEEVLTSGHLEKRPVDCCFDENVF